MSGVRFGAATNGTVSLVDFLNDEIRPRLTAELV